MGVPQSSRDLLLGVHNSDMTNDRTMSNRMHATCGGTPIRTPARRPPAPALPVDHRRAGPPHRGTAPATRPPALAIDLAEPHGVRVGWPVTSAPSRGPPKRCGSPGRGRLCGPAAEVPGTVQPAAIQRPRSSRRWAAARAGAASVVLNAGRSRPSGPQPAPAGTAGPTIVNFGHAANGIIRCTPAAATNPAGISNLDRTGRTSRTMRAVGPRRHCGQASRRRHEG